MPKHFPQAFTTIDNFYIPFNGEFIFGRRTLASFLETLLEGCNFIPFARIFFEIDLIDRFRRWTAFASENVRMVPQAKLCTQLKHFLDKIRDKGLLKFCAGTGLEAVNSQNGVTRNGIVIDIFIQLIIQCRFIWNYIGLLKKKLHFFTTFVFFIR